MKGPGYLAGNPQVTPGEWQLIVDYYSATAPGQLPPQDRRESIPSDLSLFKVRKPDLRYRNTHSSFVKIRKRGEAPVVVSDARTLKTYFLNRALEPVDSLTTDGPLVNIAFSSERKAIVCNVGMIDPNDGAQGSALQINDNAGAWKADDANLLTGLHRPVQVSPADLNNDGLTDYLVCEFGYMQGGLSWMENLGKDQYRKHSLSLLPGALKAYTLDDDQDGNTDIIALFAQGEEGIYLYANKGSGEFESKELLRFPPMNGSSYFELADFNGDGLQDILYTAGDNADYSTVLKPYHGVYIYLNRGENRFEQAFFYPIHGCYKAMARDFDNDGDLDLAAIAYYADFASQPEEGFVYLENRGDLHFNPHSSTELEIGRWITMDVGDINMDGRPDIILGNFVQPSKFANPAVNWADAPPVLILENVGE